ncbi:MAG: hypothetical protein R2743_19655 [Ilumatobacteraceae bacterium]
MTAQLTAGLPHPPYGDHVLYHMYSMGGSPPTARAWEFSGWRQETMSWKSGCYIHAGLAGAGVVEIKGPNAAEYLQGLLINSLDRFPIGSMKHGVMCNEGGLITSHGIIERLADDVFHSYAGGPPGIFGIPDAPDGVQIDRLPIFLFQIAGPTSLDLLEEVTGESLRDLKFLRFREAQVAGVKVEVARIGMSGGLAYELHGPMDSAAIIYDTVYQTGKDFGIERLGWGSYLVNHVEGGFPQATWTFVPAANTPDEWDFMRTKVWQTLGSVDPADMRARTRTPVEVNWHNMAKFDHDFVGRAALEAEIADPKRTTVTLRWNHEDVMDVYASLFRDGESFKPFDLPYTPQRWPMAYADHVTQGSESVGYSSGTVYSYHFREMLSMGCIDIDQADIGNEVTVYWGDFGGRMKEIRATVERFPYLTDRRNSDLDVTTITRTQNGPGQQ